jgi:RNA polymerase-binding transcription factor DksA
MDIVLSNNRYDEELSVMSLKSDGNVGLGITPNCLLHLHKPGNNQESRIRFTDTTTGTTASDGVSILKTDQHDLFLIVHESARMFFFTSDLVRMNILANGYVNIGSQAPNNIFQVGDGARLRISNGNTDYSLIGTKDVDDANNTRIVISGNTRSYNPGFIEYVATTGGHIFFTSSTERMRIDNNGNINIGSTATPLTKFCIKSSYSDENSGFCINASDGNTYNLKLYPFVIAGGRVGYIFKVNNISSSSLTLLFGDNGSVGIGGIDTGYKLYVNGTTYINGNTTLIGDITSTGNTYANSGKVFINAAEWSSGGTKGIFFRSGYTDYNCSILTYDHLGDGFCDGLSINGWDGISFCTGSNSRQERMRISNAGNIACTGSIGCVGVSASGGMRIGTNLGIQNATPLSMLHLGNCTVANSAPVIVLGKNNGAGGIRNAFMGYSDTFYFIIGDYGNTNTSNTLTQQLAIVYSSPALSIIVEGSGYVRMQYGYGQSSDERLKTNIKTIENALEKTLLLRGVEYNDIRIEPERKKIGLISQEVELIVPEVVRTSEEDDSDVEVKDDYDKADEDDAVVDVDLDEAPVLDLEGGGIPLDDDDDDEIPEKRGRGRRKKNEGRSSGSETYIRNRPLHIDITKPLVKKPQAPQPKPFLNTTDSRSRYSDKELTEFKELIFGKLKEAQLDFDLLKQTLSNADNHGTDDTSPSFKLLEDGSDVLSKEETAQLAIRQEKYIVNLKNALMRIENKTYGICRVSGKLIPKERLRSVPHATLGIDAKLNQSS